jgi:hypothetical protein
MYGCSQSPRCQASHCCRHSTRSTRFRKILCCYRYLPSCNFSPFPPLPLSYKASSPVRADTDEQPPKNQDEDADDYCSRIANAICSDLDIPAMGPGAIDLTIEASGAPTCIQIGVHVLKPS